MEINRADYEMLLRVPGLGYKSATRIVKARRLGTLDFADLKKLGVVLKRAVYFITCNGKTMYPLRIEEESISQKSSGFQRKTATGGAKSRLQTAFII